jgi:3-hydroxybutyryl-CoA dehydrogenase
MALPGKLNTVAVIGNGIIGHGVAQIFAMAGKHVLLIGRSMASLGAAREKVHASLEQFRGHGLIEAAAVEAALGRVTPSTDLRQAAQAELVVEAVTEDLPLKHRIFGELDGICPPPAVLASSSGQPASALVARVARRERVVAAHFWYPPQLIPLVEVCAGPETDPAVVPWVVDVLKQAGKQPVVIDKEVPGFIGNRLQFALLREAWALWASGAASAEAIDAVVRNSFGRRLAVTGPIESADVGGLDVMVSFAKFLDPEIDAGAAPPPALDRLVADGHRGLPSGRGVYDWSRRDGKALLQARMDELARWLKADRAQ